TGFICISVFLSFHAQLSAIIALGVRWLSVAFSETWALPRLSGKVPTLPLPIKLRMVTLISIVTINPVFDMLLNFLYDSLFRIRQLTMLAAKIKVAKGITG